MRFLDEVEVMVDKKEYNDNEIHRGMIGTIIDAEIRDNCFNVIFIDERSKDNDFMSIENNFLSLKDDIIYPIKIQDLKLVKENNCTDDKILEAIPLQNKNWWCKVENGYIVNLKGEKKNKIPYDYDS